MDILKTVKKCMFKNDSVLRMSVSTEAVWFIYLEEVNKKEMLFNGLDLAETNKQFEVFKFNPLINGGGIV